jgi:hypothetical protein
MYNENLINELVPFALTLVQRIPSPNFAIGSLRRPQTTLRRKSECHEIENANIWVRWHGNDRAHALHASFSSLESRDDNKPDVSRVEC